MRERHTFHVGVNLSGFAQISFGERGLVDGSIERRAGEPVRPGVLEIKGVTLAQFSLPDQALSKSIYWITFCPPPEKINLIKALNVQAASWLLSPGFCILRYR